MKILIVKLSSLGDVIHTLPVLVPLKQKYPDAHITWLVEEEASPLLCDHALIDRVLIFPKSRWKRQLTRVGTITRSIKEILQFGGAVRADRYDLVLDFQGLLKSGVLTGLARATQKRGFSPARELNHLFLTHKVPYPAGPVHSIDRYRTLVKSLECPMTTVEFSVPIQQHHRTAVWNFFEKHAIDSSRPLILLHPATRWETKMWDKHNWVVLADMLHAAHDGTIVFTGSTADKPLVDRIIGAMKKAAVNSAGAFSLNELAFLQAQADVVVTPDSGPMHLAVAVGTPVVALFGPTDPKLTGPYGDGHTVITREMNCRPCFKRQCTSKTCMVQIVPQDVCEAVHPYISCSQQQRCMTT